MGFTSMDFDPWLVKYINAKPADTEGKLYYFNHVPTQWSFCLQTYKQTACVNLYRFLAVTHLKLITRPFWILKN